MSLVSRWNQSNVTFKRLFKKPRSRPMSVVAMRSQVKVEETKDGVFIIEIRVPVPLTQYEYPVELLFPFFVMASKNI